MFPTFTDEQTRLLDYLRQHRRAAVPGCAGSGKTLVAIRFAMDLDGDGAKVLLLYPNPFLAESLRRRVQNTGILVFAFTEFVITLYQAFSRARRFLYIISPSGI